MSARSEAAASAGICAAAEGSGRGVGQGSTAPQAAPAHLPLRLQLVDEGAHGRRREAAVATRQLPDVRRWEGKSAGEGGRLEGRTAGARRTQRRPSTVRPPASPLT